MKHLQRQEQHNNLQRFPPPSCGTPPPPLSPSSWFFPASSGGSPGLFFWPQPTLRWHIVVGYRSTRLALRPHGTWCRCPRAAVWKGEEPSDETAACIESGSGEREMEGVREEKAVWIRWGSPCSAFLSVFLAVGARCVFDFSPPLLSRDFSLPFGNIHLADNRILRLLPSIFFGNRNDPTATCPTKHWRMSKTCSAMPIYAFSCPKLWRGRVPVPGLYWRVRRRNGSSMIFPAMIKSQFVGDILHPQCLYFCILPYYLPEQSPQLSCKNPWMSAWALMFLPQVVHHTQITRTFLSSTRKEIHFMLFWRADCEKCSITWITMDKRE